MDVQWPGDDINRIRALAQELVGLQSDIILTNGTAATIAVQRETRTIPIVFASVYSRTATKSTILDSRCILPTIVAISSADFSPEMRI